MEQGSDATPAIRALAGRVAPSVVSVIAYDAAYGTLAEGVGFFLSEGRIAAARHLFRGAHAARVMLAGGAVHDVLGILGEDPSAGVVVAAVDIPDRVVKPLVLARNFPAEGERVALFGGRLSPDREGVEGIVASVRDLPFLGRVFTVTCPPGAGSSGTPVAGMDGEILGTAISHPVEDGLLQVCVGADRIDAIPQGTFVRPADRPASAPGDPERFLPGVRALLLGDEEAALARFRYVADSDPKDGPAWRACAALLASLGRGREAVECARAAVNLEPEEPGAWEALGEASISAGLFPEAVDACRQVTRYRPKDARAWNRLGVACYDAGRAQEAAEACREAARLNPDDPQAHKNLGVALFALGRFPEAAEAFREAVRLRPDFDHAWKNLGLCWFRLGKLEEAVEANQEAIRIRPDYARAHNNLGVAFQALGRIEEAVQAYREALRLRPRFTQAWANLAYAWLRAGRPSEAVKAYEEAVARNPSDAESRTNLGVLYRKLGRPEDARKAFLEAIRNEPRNPAAHFHLGRLYLEQGNRGAALEEYKVLKELDEERANRLFDLVYK